MERNNKHHIGNIDSMVNDFLVSSFTKLSFCEAFKKKKIQKSDIVQKGRMGWTPKPYF